MSGREGRASIRFPGESHRVFTRNGQVPADWQKLKRSYPEAAKRCWDHLRTQPTSKIGARYGPLKGPMKYVEFEGLRLWQWQYEISRRARVKVGIGSDFVVIVSAFTGHPKENE